MQAAREGMPGAARKRLSAGLARSRRWPARMMEAVEKRRELRSGLQLGVLLEEFGVGWRARA